MSIFKEKRSKILWGIVFVILIIYWISKNNQDKKVETQIFNENNNIKYVKEDLEKNFYSANFDSLSLDKNYIHKISGVWKVISLSNEKTSFLNTLLELNDSLIFRDTISTSLTGWGKIQYSNSVKIYFSEYGSRIYEYLITSKKVLRMIEYNYRDDNSDFLTTPKLEIVDFKIVHFDQNNMELDQLLLRNKIKLIRSKK